jgi:hypothetical protein
MSALVILLILALIPTGQIFPFAQHKEASDYAICFITQRHGYKYFWKGDAELQHMVVSVLLLGLGMTFRIIRLHARPVRLLSAIKRSVRKKLSNALHRIEVYCGNTSNFSRLVTSLLFIPSLSAFVVLRTLVDLWSSMAFEVGWAPLLESISGITDQTI